MVYCSWADANESRALEAIAAAVKDFIALTVRIEIKV
jgi:hypothetical protein